MDNRTVAIVTGASQGIGKATAVRLARDFSVVVLAARIRDDLGKTAFEVKSAGTDAMVYALDLRDLRASETVSSGTLERFGRIDALLNIAGAVPQIDLFEMTDAQWDDDMALKFHAARRLTIVEGLLSLFSSAPSIPKSIGKGAGASITNGTLKAAGD